ncbi:TonB-dependent receptor domain-containing protein [Methyloradius palustris]|uniref:Secretin/TonB short N-terminal domain-containing protein n=1 Tax=Methyloradius palustris TaxID=2778876 RepID=A0A8D5JL44_9PROT|nr:TonB-dependent receptor [Methyloradius palustris]BCM24520.1 hypothetical protein ZMTM_07790 [Methyloradius palustris]
MSIRTIEIANSWPLICRTAFAISLIVVSTCIQAAELNTNLPPEKDGNFIAPIRLDIPSQPLDVSLKQFSNATGVDVSFDSDVARNKTAPAIKGSMTRKEALHRLLAGSGLDADIKDGSAVIRPVPDKDALDMKLEAVTVRAKRFYEVGPLPGLGLTLDEIPGNVQSISAKEIKESHSLSITDLMNKKLQSVNINDYQGNPFQMDVTYRGFTAGPQIGTPQGLSVFFDGIRVNEPFGDVVNWDMIPMNALAGVDVFPGSNPIFGLNTLGGAFTLKTKDGFTDEGLDAEILSGSFGRKQLQIESGWNNGTLALFGAGNFFLEDGFRKNSPSKVNQFFGKASYRGDKLDLNLSTLLVKTDLVGNGLLPSEEYARDSSSVFTAPDTTKNKLIQFQLSGAFQVSDTFSVTGQVYRRKSDRHSIGADVYTGFSDSEILQEARRVPAPGEQWTCLLDSHNKYGLPDYYVVTVDNPTGDLSDLFGNNFFLDSLGNNFVGNPALLPQDVNGNPIGYNADLDPVFAKNLLDEFNQDRNKIQAILFQRTARETFIKTQGPVTSYSNGQGSYATGSFETHLISDGYANSVISTSTLDEIYFYSPDGKKNFVYFVSPKNNDTCTATKALDTVANAKDNAFEYIDPRTGHAAFIDGALDTVGIAGPGTGPGVVSYTEPITGKTYYTPTAVFNDNNINQIVNGASIQLNWNLEQHKFMVGGSIDAADSTYTNTSQLGFLDANRNAYLAPDLANPAFAGADVPLANNDFSGTNTTKSIYFSETWTPLDTWHFNTSARYNITQAKSTIATRTEYAALGLNNLISYPDFYAVCPNGDCTGVPTDFHLPNLSDVLDKAETEKFNYYSFNPSIGATWQAKENLNIYTNLAKGARVPSVVELGCAFDRTPYSAVNSTPRSLVEGRECTLPNVLSGDPYLKQIKSVSYDLGMRGSFKSLLGAEDIKWNLGAYQTNLADDIYFIAVPGGNGFFDNIGNTRRQGIEAGLSGRKDRLSFSVNYGLTDATFQSQFREISNDNSSAVDLHDGYGRAINVKKGDRMPGVPLQNLNASINYEITPKWNMGVTAVMHSGSYVRGNENNEHQPGVSRTRQLIVESPPGSGNYIVADVPLPPTTNPGKLPGYATFNLQTSYKFNPEWTATLQVNNLLDKEYFSAGRLGRNPFSPSIYGEIGPDGYNHNSGDWLSTNFIAPAAPRGIWVSLRYEFSPDK